MVVDHAVCAAFRASNACWWVDVGVEVLGRSGAVLGLSVHTFLQCSSERIVRAYAGLAIGFRVEEIVGAVGASISARDAGDLCCTSSR